VAVGREVGVVQGRYVLSVGLLSSQLFFPSFNFFLILILLSTLRQHRPLLTRRCHSQLASSLTHKISGYSSEGFSTKEEAEAAFAAAKAAGAVRKVTPEGSTTVQ
jgi:hypothetical protein